MRVRPGSLKRLAKVLIGLTAAVGVLLLASALVVPRVIGRTREARRMNSIVQMRLLVSELERYRIDNNGRAPSTEQGLEALVREPTSPPKPKRWKGPYIEEVPRDGWGNPYQYASVDGGKGFRVWSLGADGAEGGEGPNAEIRSWQQSTWSEE